MDLLKQLSEDVQAYKDFLGEIVKKIEIFDQEISQEKRLGLIEAEDYYQRGTEPAFKQPETVDFKAPTEPVAKPVQHPMAGRAQRTHLIYDPSKGKVVDVVKTDPRARPPAEYMEANSQQVEDALKHIKSFSPEIAQRLKSGMMTIWIPRTHATIPGSDMMQKPTGGVSKVDIGPERLAAAKQAASKMELA